MSSRRCWYTVKHAVRVTLWHVSSSTNAFFRCRLRHWRRSICLLVRTWYTMDVSLRPPARYSSRASLRRVWCGKKWQWLQWDNSKGVVGFGRNFRRPSVSVMGWDKDTDYCHCKTYAVRRRGCNRVAQVDREIITIWCRNLLFSIIPSRSG